jgi:hypothetical protein
MRWHRHSVHLPVQIRLAVFLGGRWPHLFQRWYPRLEPAGLANSLRPLTIPHSVITR